ncbi:MAG: PAC2 family protein [Candidatus Omnitrophota bacterium]|nr:PAC2 family protein [Candidatus Omnitrophota bacterium]
MIKIQRNIKAKNPIFIAAWPGMGSVSLKAAIFLKEKLKAFPFAEFEAKDFFYVSDILIEDTLVKVPTFPQAKFYYWQNKKGKNDLIIFISEAQPSPDKILPYTKEILDFISTFKVRMIYTFAAMPLPIDHLQKSQVWVTATHKGLAEQFKKFNVKPLTTGMISGLNGLFLGLAKEQKFSGFCLLGEIPLYTIQIENPKASLAVVEVLNKELNLEIDLNELQLAGKIMEEEIEHLIDYLKHPLDEHEKPISDEEIEKIRKTLAAQSRIPESAKKKIEELFNQSHKDITKAADLKKELDSWNVYKEYEDRFLDLFRKKEKKDN